MNKIALFFGGKISQHLVLIKKAAKKMGVRLDLVSYNRVTFDTQEQKVKIRGNLSDVEGQTHRSVHTIKNEGWLDINDYDVLFFRTTGKHWEEVDLIVGGLNPSGPPAGGPAPLDRGATKGPIVVDPLVLGGKPSMACKAWQMLALKKAGIEVPKSTYGSLWYLYEIMSEGLGKPNPYFTFPIIIKGSGGDRGTRVYKADNLNELEKLVIKLRKSETEEGKRYMLQEYIPNDGDYRVLILGKKVLGVMKRTRQLAGEFRNNYSTGGKVEIADLPEDIKQLTVKAAEVCGLSVAGVDVMAKNPSGLRPAPLDRGATEGMSNDPKDYVILEVNKGPQFRGFMKATGIDVPAEIVKFLAELNPPSDVKSESSLQKGGL
ncbi:MAG: hypothetical protein NTY75_03545 [Candidatus Shapirobacteria bacterium]|nr:hypothetical protein [Candidatus Shapirobacteria bacterium]